MKYFKLIICAVCLAILLTACGGKAHKNMGVPAFEEEPVGKIEIVDPVRVQV
jgi:hypothetical protein